MTHRFAFTVHYEDTDMSGLVYHANYLKFVERARSAWVAGLGVDQRAMLAGGTAFVVARIEADFLAPARFGESLEVETAPEAAARARAVLVQTVRRGETPLFRARVTLAAIGPAGRPVRLPAPLAAAFSA